jgi:hypothetical protein
MDEKDGSAYPKYYPEIIRFQHGLAAWPWRETCPVCRRIDVNIQRFKELLSRWGARGRITVIIGGCMMTEDDILMSRSFSDHFTIRSGCRYIDQIKKEG